MAKHGVRVVDSAFDTFLGLADLSGESKRKVLWDDCARLYKL